MHGEEWRWMKWSWPVVICCINVCVQISFLVYFSAVMPILKLYSPKKQDGFEMTKVWKVVLVVDFKLPSEWLREETENNQKSKPQVILSPRRGWLRDLPKLKKLVSERHGVFRFKMPSSEIFNIAVSLAECLFDEWINVVLYKLTTWNKGAFC